MVISILLKIGTVKFPKNLHIGLITKKLFFQIKKLNESNFFLIIIYILIQFKVFIILPENLYGLLTFRMHCYWYIDHHMALQLTTVQLDYRG